MKKLFVLLMVVAMIACLSVSAFAAPGDDPTLTLGETSGSDVAGTSDSKETTIAKTGFGPAEKPVIDSVSPSGQGVTAAVSADGNTLTVTYDATATADTYTITVKCTKGEKTATAAYTLTLTDPHVCGDGVKQDGQAATCMAPGWKDYYKCSCDKLYEEETCENEITDLEAWKIGAGATEQLKHEDILKKTDEVKATCAAAGCKKYFYCESCTNYFADPKGNKEIGDDTPLALLAVSVLALGGGAVVVLKKKHG